MWLLAAFIVSNVCGSAAAPRQEGEGCGLTCENLVLTRTSELSSNVECWLATASCLPALSFRRTCEVIHPRHRCKRLSRLAW